MDDDLDGIETLIIISEPVGELDSYKIKRWLAKPHGIKIAWPGWRVWIGYQLWRIRQVTRRDRA